MARLPEPVYSAVSVVFHRTDGSSEMRTFSEPREIHFDRLVEVATGRLDVVLSLTEVAGGESFWEMPATKRNGEG